MVRVWDSGVNNAQQNMAYDKNLLANISKESECILHLYDWDGNAATYGHFIKPDEYFRQEGLHAHSLSIAKRPTGGGIIFHWCDYAFSLCIPASHPLYATNTLQCYSLVNQIVSDAIKTAFGKQQACFLLDRHVSTQKKHERFCMAAPTKFDVLLKGKKVGGAAQRRTREGVLHQGTILLVKPKREILEQALYNGGEIHEEIEKNSSFLLGTSSERLQNSREELKQGLISELSRF